jgi:CHAT domain-containing protein
LLTEALSLGDADLHALPLEEQREIKKARREIQVLEAKMRLLPGERPRRDEREVAEALGQVRASLKELIKEIQIYQPDFMPTGLDLPAILNLIPDGGAFVLPLITLQGSVVFILPHGIKTVEAKHALPLAAFTTRQLNTWLRDNSGQPGWLQGGTTKEWKADIEKMIDQLGQWLVGSIHACLVELGLERGAPVVFMPQGGLGLLPLHAAWCHRNGQRHMFLDDYTVTYAPSAYALSVSQRRLPDRLRHNPSLLAIINPENEEELSFPTAIGEEAITPLFSEVARAVNREAVAQAASRYVHLLFYCHGFYNWRDVMGSSLKLADGFLTLNEILSGFALGMNRLVVLAACETGFTESQHSPDEYIGLPAGFLQVGSPGVLSTLWKVHPLPTALLSYQFYKSLLSEKLSPATALQKAQVWLRDLTANELLAYLQALENQIRTSNLVLSNELAQFYERYPETRPFAHPYYWAAFTFTGA